MPVATDVEYRYGGGAANTDPTASLGGAMSTAAGGVVDDGVKNDLWPDVSAADAAAGVTHYRGFYIAVKASATGTLTAARIYMSGDSANANDIHDLAIADEAENVQMETIANEDTAPVGPTFSHPTTYAGGIAIADLSASDERGVWARRTIGAGAASGSITDNEYMVEGTTV